MRQTAFERMSVLSLLIGGVISAPFAPFAPAQAQPASRAIVLGGGGPVGEAWETGIVVAPAHSGIDLSRAELIVGTSAGAIVGARLAYEMSPREMVAGALERADRPPPGANNSPPSLSGPPQDLSFLIERFRLMNAGMLSGAQASTEIGAWSMKLKPTVPASIFVASYERRFPQSRWPRTRFEPIAVDAANGSLKVWSAADGVRLALAVASSCAFPGPFAPVEIGGRSYIDGGVLSATNAELARNFKRVLVLAPTIGHAGVVEDRSRSTLDEEVRALRGAGSEVLVIAPDGASLVAFGPALGDEKMRKQGLDAGLRQGRAEFAKIRDFWR